MSELIDDIDPLFLKYLQGRGISSNEYLDVNVHEKITLSHDYEESKKAQGNAGGSTEKFHKFICKFKNIQKTIHLLGAITIERIRDEVKRIWDQFELEEFSLFINSINVDSYHDLNLLPDDSIIVVESKCKPFSSFKKVKDVQDLAKIKATIKDNKQFPKDANILSSSIDIMVDTVYNELRRRLVAYDISGASEYTMREFISPILVGAIVLLGELSIKMTAEKTITGKFANGPVDYDIFYRDFHICIDEAKKLEIEYGIAQNIAQIVTSRDVFIFEESKKRSHGVAFTDSDINAIPSSGIISTGNEWIFSKYVYENEQWKLYLSKTYNLTLDEDEDEHMKTQIKELLLVIVSILSRQKAKVDEFDNKRQ
mmetsp:Transcript_15553/g.14084  ORF Transcript_15553/g.14084 Transcript_15553/m.14084 type:complete len:369 (-) Transcript_15553:91-1197(-)